nr:hypothetical protein [uncultured Mediterranean phage uvMED]
MSTLAVGTIKSISSAAPVFQNTSGTEKGQLCKVWVSFNGTGTIAIRDSFNVSSLTDNGNAGAYTVNFSNAMANANYCAMISAGNDAENSKGRWNAIYDVSTTVAGSCRLALYSGSGAYEDNEQVFFAAFGD